MLHCTYPSLTLKRVTDLSGSGITGRLDGEGGVGIKDQDLVSFL